MKHLDIQEIRKELDVIDQEMVTLFKKRMDLCKDVAEFKIQTGKPVYDKEREDQKIDAVTGMVEGEFLKQAVRELFAQMMTISRRYQYKQMAEHGLSEDHSL